MNKHKYQECSHHNPLFVDCDRFNILWYALENFKESIKAVADKTELDLIEAMQKELWDTVVEEEA